MDHQQMFGNAVWLAAPQEEGTGICFLRGRFTAHRVTRAVLRVVGLGFFHCTVNGSPVSDDLFLPLNSDYEPREQYPRDERMSGHHLYVPEYDITHLLRDGENIIAICFGGGWYTRKYKKKQGFGCAKAIWRVFGEGEDGAWEACATESDRIAPAFVTAYDLTTCEHHDYRLPNVDALSADFDDGAWSHAIPAKAPDTTYALTDCPADGVQELLPVTCLAAHPAGSVYDCGKNTTGYPLLVLHGRAGDAVRVRFSEELGEDGLPDARFSHGQELVYICDGTPRTVHPLFTWFGFRYFAVEGDAHVEGVQVVHAKVTPAADFRSDNELLNWIHDTFRNTQLTNMHTGIPSDCPHIERRGYTGDGQLVCHAAMNLLAAGAFYRKWIDDICDCQDVETGHIQYTAPYVRSGGGPGGWGCAIVEVPYEYYLQYGDVAVLRKCYPQMLRYFDYLETHSHNDLVIRDKEGEWCLGDWCPPITVILPAPFVNNYFYIKSLRRCIDIARLIGKEADIPMLEDRIARRAAMIDAAYANPKDGNYVGNVQGANAFALDIGLGNEQTYENLVRYYESLGAFDTGIFGTDVVCRVLFARGNGALAVRLLTSQHVHSFAEMKRRGATTIWEYWPQSLRDRSHNHPMFGAITAYFYDYLLGIRPREAGYGRITVAPVLTEAIGVLSGYRDLPRGRVSVAYETQEDVVRFTVTVPQGIEAQFALGDVCRPLPSGETTELTVPRQKCAEKP